MKNEPIAVTGVIAAIVTLFAGIGLDLSPEAVAGVSTIAATGAALFQHFRTSTWYTWAPKTSPVAVGGVVVAAAAVVTSLGLNLDTELVTTIQTLVVAGATLLGRQFSTPSA